MMELNFDGQIVVVTGAGNGLGRSHALLFAARGARVVVNDVGADLAGRGESLSPADQVVAEIEAIHGKDTAVASHDGVHTPEGGEAIIRTALDRFGRIDALVCNAGILINEPFAEMSDETWRRTLAIHLDGTMYCARAAWREMRRAGYGRLVFTASGGILGKAGLTAYSAAKAGIYGLMRSLAQEVGPNEDIRVNTVLPAAATRMVSPETRALWEARPELGDPAHVSPVVAFLASRTCPENGKAYTAGGGFVAREEFVQGQGARFDRSQSLTPEQVAARWGEIHDLSEPRAFESALSSGAVTFGLS